MPTCQGQRPNGYVLLDKSVIDGPVGCRCQVAPGRLAQRQRLYPALSLRNRETAPGAWVLKEKEFCRSGNVEVGVVRFLQTGSC
jgi:hypothetical protein